MIYLNEQTENKLQFESLLQRTKEILLTELEKADNPASLSGTTFEDMTFDAAKSAAEGTEFEGKLAHTGAAAFPDIVAAGYFGIEVKATKKDDWRSIGNSVLESSRQNGIERIYLFFGKLGGAPDIEYRTYEECLRAIAVTHYPRYVIDMKLAPGKSIFDKMEVSYDTLRSTANPISHVRDYYKTQLKEGQALWWIDDNSDSTPSLSPIIKSFSSIDAEERDRIKADIFIRFPEILSNSTTKFENVAAYLASERGIVSSNLRDNFTAGGRVDLTLRESTIQVPQIINELLRVAPLIAEKIGLETRESLSNYWRKHIEGFVDSETSWKDEMNRQSAHMELNLGLSDLYEAVLTNELKVR